MACQPKNEKSARDCVPFRPSGTRSSNPTNHKLGWLGEILPQFIPRFQSQSFVHAGELESILVPLSIGHYNPLSTLIVGVGHCPVLNRSFTPSPLLEKPTAAMSAAPTSRAIVRQSKLLLRRNNFRQASTTSEAATKAKETGQQAVSKASEGLSRVQSSASSAISKAGDALGKVGGRTGRVISRIQCTIRLLLLPGPHTDQDFSINTTNNLLFTRWLGTF